MSKWTELYTPIYNMIIDQSQADIRYIDVYIVTIHLLIVC